MKVLVAGATGAIGKPVINALIQAGQETYGITHSESRAAALAAAGAKPVILDIFDSTAVDRALADIRPDVVIDMLTALPKQYNSESMRDAAELDARTRLEGGGNLHAAAESHGVKRYIQQSSAFWYAPGAGLADESQSFAWEATPGIAAGVKVYSALEKRVLQSTKMEGIALRFGFFYGPGTWFCAEGDVADQVRRKQFPIIGKGQGIWNFIHIDDAGQAAADAVYTRPGAYNIVNNRPAAVSNWLPAFAQYVGAPYPDTISEQSASQQFGADRVYYATMLRGASNAKAKQEYNFQPRTFEWFA